MKKIKEAKNARFQMGFILRYLSLLILALFISLLPFLSNILLILTIYPVNFLLSLVYSSAVLNNSILLESLTIKIIPSCLAVSAFLLIIILNMTTPMKPIKRLFSLVFSMILLLVLNILRIFGLSVLLVNNYSNFDIVHKFLWYFLSIVLVILVWFITAYVFKIKNIPIYSDFKALINQIKIKSKNRT